MRTAMLRGDPALVGGLRCGGVVVKAQGLHDMAPVVEEQHEAMVDCDKTLHIGRLVRVRRTEALPEAQDPLRARSLPYPRAMSRLSALFLPVIFASLTLVASPAQAGLTLWPTCIAPPAGDFARCDHGAFPQSIIGGPDGAMWFTTARADLGRVTTSGAFAQVDVPLGAGGAQLLGGLTVGPDGNLWFPAAFGMPYLYRATPSSPPVFTLDTESR